MKPVKTFETKYDDAEIVAALNVIEPIITNEQAIPHSRSKLKEYPLLAKFFQDHMVEGLYLLQFRKCRDLQCCTLRTKELPPRVPAPVLSPDKQHCLDFKDLYGKVCYLNSFAV